jgi:hypothetical protein
VVLVLAIGVLAPFSQQAKVSTNTNLEKQRVDATGTTLKREVATVAITVTNTNDSGAGSLRDAINQANSDGAPTEITFNAGLAGQTIQPQSPLPPLNENGTTINGDVNGDCHPDIELDGQLVTDDGIKVFSSNIVIRGLIINRFAFNGVNISGNDNHLECNYIGTDATGTQNRGNGHTGVIIVNNGSSNNQVGPGNIIAFNSGTGITVADGANFAYPDFIGLTPDYTGLFPVINFPHTSAAFRSSNGITPIDGSGHPFADNFGARFTGTLNVGATGSYTFSVSVDDQARLKIDGSVVLEFNQPTDGQATIPVSNGNHSIELDYFDGPGAARLSLAINGPGTATLTSGGNPGVFGEFFQLRIPSEQNRITQNSIFGNNGLGIDLDALEDNFGVNPNDPGDGDVGPNTALNFPEFNFVTDNGGGSFTLDGNAPPNSTVEIFATTGDDPSGNGEGKLYLTSVTANGGGGFSVTIAAPGGYSKVTATATDTNGNTSEFSRNKALAQSRWGATQIFSNLPDISGPAGYVTGDLNGDGRLDLVAIGHGNNTPCRLLVLMQNASGNYDGISQEPMGVNQGLCNGRDALALGDVDGDGDLDLIAQGTDNTSTPRLILFLNDGTGTLIQQPDIFGPGLFQGAVALGDVDGDGDLDLAASGQDSNGVERFLIFSNNGAGGFTLTQQPRGVNTGYFQGSSLVFGDVDSDGDLDIVISGGGNNTKSLHVYKNNAGQFSLSQQLVVGSEGLNNSLLRLADLDRDGDLDLVAVGNNFDGGQRVRLVTFQNLGQSFSNSFTTLKELPGGSWAGLAVGDCNGDGYPDVFANGHDGLNFRLFYFQSQSGTLVETDQPQVNFVGPILFGDFDGDNDLDMVGLPVRYLYTNLLGPANAAPGVPSALSANVAGPSANLTWTSATDTESGSPSLSYEVRLGTAPGQYNRISGAYGTPLMGTYPLSRLSPGQPGRKLNLGAGTYYWQVRAIDTGLRAGGWSAESSFTIQPALTINDVTVTEGDSGTVNAVFTVTLLNPSGTVSVDYSTANGSAVAGSDYTAAAGTLTLSSATPTQKISIAVNGDTVGEADENFFVNLSNPSGAVFADSRGQCIILNDDPQPTISINDAAAPEGNSGTRSLLFTVSMSGATDQDVTVNYNLVDQSATAGSDYVGASGTIMLFAGETTHTLAVTLIGDTIVEGNETFRVDLSNPINATLADNQGIGTIIDDEGVTEPPLNTTWQKTHEGMTGIFGAATNGSIYVVVGNSGDIWTSPDSINWTKRTNPDTTNRDLRGVTFGGGQFAAVGSAPAADGGSLILTSPDGITWTQRSTVPLTRNLTGVAYGNGTYVATTPGGVVLTSPDAITWAQRVLGINQRLNGIAFGGGQFAAVGNERTVVTSPDGISWTIRGGIPTTIVRALNAVTHDGSKFIAVSSDPSGQRDSGSGVMTSPDGINWTQQTVPVNQPLLGVTAAGGLIVAVGAGGSSGSTIITSPDGVNWTGRAIAEPGAGVSRSFRAVTYGAAGFLAADGRGNIFTSPDGIANWITRTLTTSRMWRSVAHNGTVYCAVGDNGVASTSPDGVTWTQQTTPDPTAYYFWWSVTYGNGLFVASGISDSIMTSPDGINWTVRNPATPLVPLANQTSNLTDITYANGLFVAVGEAYLAPGQTIAHIITSPDGVTWTTHDPGLPQTIQGYNWIAVAYGNGKFVVALTEFLSGECLVLTSPDGQTWTRQPSPLFDPGETFLDIVYGKGQFVAVGDRIWTSPDGINWTLRLDYSTTFFNGVAYGDGRFIAVGFQGGIYASTNGTNWSPQVGATPRLQNAVTASLSGIQFVSAGDSVIEYANFTANTTINISDVTVAEGNSGTVNAVFTVTLTNTDGSAAGAAVNFNTVNGTATTADNDYQANAGAITFLPMETTKQITVLVNGDTMFEPNEAFTVHLSNSTGATISDADGTGTITNDDSAPTFAIDDVTHNEGNAGTTSYTFTVTKTGSTALNSAVSFSTVDGTATTANNDYQTQSGTLNFLPADTTKTITVLVNGDTTVEPDEAFTIHLSGASGATITDADGTGSIINDDCNISLSGHSENFTASGGAGSVTLTTTSACAWMAVSNDSSYITITSGASGSGNGAVNYSVGANTGPARMGTMTIAAQTFTVTQDQGCTFMLSSTNQNFGAAGGMNSVNVITATGCTWAATSNAGFITIDSGSSGSGNGTVNYSVGANTGPARMGTMTIAGLTFTVTQDSGCTFTLDQDHQSLAGNGGLGTVNVTALDSACAWTASTTATFIHITSGSAGSGNGSVQYSVDANLGTTIRSDTITIAGHTFTVYQGIDFLDVPSNHPFYNEIGMLSARGVTLGCGNGNYCPNDPVTREQMAAFILRATGEFDPPPPSSQRFNDVPPQNVFYNFIDRLAVLQITLGCTPDHLFYCPSDPVKREQMAAFLLRGLGEFDPPTPGSQRFNDVPPANVFYNFIDRLAVLQITLGCTPDHVMYCPSDSVTRAQMAAFLVRAFNL